MEKGGSGRKAGEAPCYRVPVTELASKETLGLGAGPTFWTLARNTCYCLVLQMLRPAGLVYIVPQGSAHKSQSGCFVHKS